MGMPLVGRCIAGGRFLSTDGSLGTPGFLWGCEPIIVTTPETLWTVRLRDAVAHGMPVDQLICVAQKNDNIAGATFRMLAISRTGSLDFVINSVDVTGASTAFAAPDSITFGVFTVVTPSMRTAL